MKPLKPLVLVILIPLGLACSRAEDGAGQATDKASSQNPAPASAPAAQAAAASATIGAKLGEFYFPIKNITRQWEWQAAPANSLVYKWSVTLPLGNETYQVGFMRFCSDPKAKGSGPFEKLIASGQVNIWKMNAKGGASLEQSLTKLTAKRQGDGLLIQLKEPALLEMLLAQRPETLVFESLYGAYPSAPHREDVTVTYKP